MEQKPPSPLGLEGDFATDLSPLPPPSPPSLKEDFATDYPPIPSPSSLPDHRTLHTPHKTSRHSVSPPYRSIQNIQVSGTSSIVQDSSSLIDNKVSICAEPFTQGSKSVGSTGYCKRHGTIHKCNPGHHTRDWSSVHRGVIRGPSARRCNYG